MRILSDTLGNVCSPAEILALWNALDTLTKLSPTIFRYPSVTRLGAGDLIWWNLYLRFGACWVLNRFTLSDQNRRRGKHGSYQHRVIERLRHSSCGYR